MIISWCRKHLPEEPCGLDEASLGRVEEHVGIETPPFGVRSPFLLAVRTSEFYRSEGPRPQLTTADWPQPSASERARLLAKGQLLFEHCLESENFVCTLGFFDHELTKGATMRPVLAELLAWMTEQRLSGNARTEPRASLCEYMLDFGVSLLHGLPREAALELAEHKDPT